MGIGFCGFSNGKSCPLLSIKNIDNQEMRRLQNTFRNFQALDSKVGKESIVGKNWNCDLYGIRTRLQVEKDLLLYSFRGLGDSMINKGAQPISRYSWTKIGLQGTNDKLTDVLRFSPDRQNLIAELSVDIADLPTTNVLETNSLVSPRRRVVAYALCK